MFKILDEVCTPKRGTKYSAYIDLFSAEDVTIGAGETKIVKLGVKIDNEELKRLIVKSNGSFMNREDLPLNFIENRISMFLSSHYLEVALRSSLGVKGLIIANGIGIIDLDYPDEIGLIVHNPIDVEQSSFIALCMNENFDKDNIELIGNDLKIVRAFKIKKGDKVAQCTLKEHKGYLIGYESDVIRYGGFGSTGK